MLFREARAQSSWTKPAVATFLTGLYPVSHGADRRARGIADGVVTLAERLAAAGYETAFFTTNPTVTDRFGFHRGFEEFRYLSLPRGRRRGHVDATEINREVFSWLDRRDEARPFFLVVHTLDPHDPYEPREPFRSRFAGAVTEAAARSACCIRARELAKLDVDASLARARDSIALYDAEIAQNDAAFGELLDELSRRSLYDASAIVLTSDHGEEFYEHGSWRHANTLYEEVLRIPFVLRLPDGERAGLSLDSPLDQVDLAPTFLALAGAPIPAELPGESWLPALAGGPAPDRESLAWLEHPAISISSIRLGSWKALRTVGAWRPPVGRAPDELYDLGADPGELRDLAATDALRRRWAIGRMTSAGSRLPRAGGEDVEIDAELDRTLRALGYL